MATVTNGLCYCTISDPRGLSAPAVGYINVNGVFLQTFLHKYQANQRFSIHGSGGEWFSLLCKLFSYRTETANDHGLGM